MNGPRTASAEGPSEEAQGLSRKRVANAVRKVVSKVLPGEEPGSAKEPAGRGVRSICFILGCSLVAQPCHKSS